MQLTFGEHTRPRVLRAAPSPVASRRKHTPNGWVVHAPVCSARARNTAREGACAPLSNCMDTAKDDSSIGASLGLSAIGFGFEPFHFFFEELRHAMFGEINLPNVYAQPTGE